MRWDKVISRLAVMRGLRRLFALKEKAKPKRPTKRERIFTGHISVTEGLLQAEFSRVDEFASKIEKALHKGLGMLYSGAKTKIKDGQVVLDSRGNGEIKKQMREFVKELRIKMRSGLLNAKTIDILFNPMKAMAIQTVADNTEALSLASVIVNESQFRSFKRGYISNVDAVIINDPRRWLESIDANFGQEVALSLAIKQVGTLGINRNNLKLSTITHPRAAFKNITFENFNKQGFTHFKMVVPPFIAPKLAPSGTTASLLFLILTTALWNKKANKGTDGKNANTVSGLGLHHGSQDYYYPIESDMLEEEEEIAREQRRRLEAKFKKQP